MTLKDLEIGKTAVVTVVGGEEDQSDRYGGSFTVPVVQK